MSVLEMLLYFVIWLSFMFFMGVSVVLIYEIIRGYLKILRLRK